MFQLWRDTMCSFTSSVVTASIILQIVILPRETWGKTYKANILETTDNRGYQQVCYLQCLTRYNLVWIMDMFLNFKVNKWYKWYW